MPYHDPGERNTSWSVNDSRYTEDEHKILVKAGFFVGYGYSVYTDDNNRHRHLEIYKEDHGRLRGTFQAFNSVGLTLEEAIARVHKEAGRENDSWLKTHDLDGADHVPF